MRTTVISLTALIVVATAQPALMQNGQFGQESVSTAAQACPDTVAWTGKYQNHTFGFTIVIPEQLKGFWNSAACVAGPDGCTCMGDHGRIIPLSNGPLSNGPLSNGPLSNEPERNIEVYAGHASDLEKPTVAAEISRRLRWIRERSRKNSLQVRKRSNITLAGLRGQRVTVRYFDHKLESWLIEDFVELVRLGRIEYLLDLKTREDVYNHDRAIFETVISSFALTHGEYTD